MNLTIKPAARIPRSAPVPGRSLIRTPATSYSCVPPEMKEPSPCRPGAPTRCCEPDQVGRLTPCAPSDDALPTHLFTTLPAGRGLPAPPLRQPTPAIAQRPGVRRQSEAATALSCAVDHPRPKRCRAPLATALQNTRPGAPVTDRLIPSAHQPNTIRVNRRTIPPLPQGEGRGEGEQASPVINQHSPLPAPSPVRGEISVAPTFKKIYHSSVGATSSCRPNQYPAPTELKNKQRVAASTNIPPLTGLKTSRMTSSKAHPATVPDSWVVESLLTVRRRGFLPLRHSEWGRGPGRSGAGKFNSCSFVSIRGQNFKYFL